MGIGGAMNLIFATEELLAKTGGAAGGKPKCIRCGCGRVVGVANRVGAIVADDDGVERFTKKRVTYHCVCKQVVHWNPR